MTAKTPQMTSSRRPFAGEVGTLRLLKLFDKYALKTIYNIFCSLSVRLLGQMAVLAVASGF
jgi:hypothetical protein